MDIEKFQQKIDTTNYWDAYALDFRAEFFGDECKLYYEIEDAKTDSECWEIVFKRCFKVYYETDAGWTSWNSPSGVRNFDMKQVSFESLMSHSVQDIKLVKYQDACMIEVAIMLSSMSITIICQDVHVSKVSIEQQHFFWDRTR